MATIPTQYENDPLPFQLPQWMFDLHEYRKSLILTHLEPIVVKYFGPLEEERQNETITDNNLMMMDSYGNTDHVDFQHRRLGFLPSYVEDVGSFHESSMSFASLAMLVMVMSCLFLVFVSCFYHNQKTSPLFISPRRHRLPKLVPPPLPVDGFFSWVRVCFFLDDEEIINRVGYDSLIFLRFHRLALRCIVKMSLFSFVVIIPLNFTGGGHANASDLKGYVGSLLFTDFLRFTMANVSGGSPRLWVHCFAAYLLTGIVVRELLIEYEAFNAIRHRYLLSREPHLRSVLVTNIPRHLRAPGKIDNYFRHVYPNAVKSVTMCQNLIRLESLIKQRTDMLAIIERQVLLLCRSEKRKLFQYSRIESCTSNLMSCGCLEDLGVIDGTQERLTRLYSRLEELNDEIEQEQRRRRRVMKRLDKMEAWDGRRDIDYLLASPFLTDDPKQRQILGLGNEGNQYLPPTIGAPRKSDGSLHDMVNSTTGDSSSHVTFAESVQQHPSQLQSNGPVLRSQSPTPSMMPDVSVPVTDNEGDGIMKGDDSSKRKSKKPFQRAKQAIRRYSRLAREVTFFGRRMESNAPQPSDLGRAHIEAHTNEVTDKAFVTMNTFTASTIAIQSMHSSRPGSMQVATAPEPRDILWENIYVSKGAHRTRSYVGEALVLLIIGFYVLPMAIISLLVSESALVSSSPRLAQLAEASAFFYSAIAVVQPLCIVSLQQLLPPLFILIGKAEGMLSFSGVQQRAFSRYFLFQVINVFLVTTIAGSIFDTIAIIVENPEAAFEMLGNSLPRLSSFFITLVTIKTFVGLGMELVRTMSIVQASLRYILFPNSTLRAQRSVRLGMRAIDDPGWFAFHKILAQDMLVVVISVVFAVVAPLVLLPCAVFCLFSRIMWTHHHLYVYESVFETGGQFWPKIFRRFVFGLIIAQMTITGQFILKEARHEAYATIALMFLTYFFLRSTRARYDPSSSTLPLEVATIMDISIAQEKEEAMRRQNQQYQQQMSSSPTIQPGTTPSPLSDMRTRTASSAESETDTFEHHLGTRIGFHDPFEKAYVQPSLRANPRAKPEQPFPPNQLGREEALMGHHSNYAGGGDTNGLDNSFGNISNDVCDSGATVRLKALNQQERRLINRWWSDQLQRCGKQDLIPILMGQECGTLRIGTRTNLVELNPRQGESV